MEDPMGLQKRAWATSRPEAWQTAGEK